MRIERAAATAIASANVALGLVIGLGLLGKLVDPRAAFETAQRVTSSAGAALVVVVLAVVLETGFCASAVTGLLRRRVLTYSGLGLLVTFIGWLLLARAKAGFDAQGGCLGIFHRAPVSAALLGDTALAAQVSVVCVLDAIASALRRARQHGCSGVATTSRAQ